MTRNNYNGSLSHQLFTSLELRNFKWELKQRDVMKSSAAKFVPDSEIMKCNNGVEEETKWKINLS